ncbi:MAG: lysoplasmalogenase [Acidimicrobiia bacterium]|jgi:uncharacterized membrane protein YhhN
MTWIALTVLATAALVWCERTGSAWRSIAKPVASAGFVGLALTRSDGSTYDLLIVAGAALGMVGDVALLGAGRRSFLAGLAAFLAGHLAYLAAFAGTLAEAGPLPWLAALGVASAAALGGGSWRWLRPHLPGDLRLPVAAYVVVICTTMAVALAIGSVHPTAAAGAVLFAVSDLAVARQAFVEESFLNRAVGLPLYYAGQVLIALSVG